MTGDYFKCAKCFMLLARSCFFKNTKRASGITSYCRSCNKRDVADWRKKNRDASRLWAKRWYADNPEKRFYYNTTKTTGVTLEQFKEMQSAQNNLCAICKKAPSGKRLHIDHCHKTGKIRGLLCYKCNVGIGYFNDSEEMLTAAIKYLRREKYLVTA